MVPIQRDNITQHETTTNNGDAENNKLIGKGMIEPIALP